MSLGSLTYHFSNQQELLREALELFLTEELARLSGVNEKLHVGTWDRDQAATAFEALLEAHRARRITKLELYLHAAREPDLQVAVTSCFRAYDELARTALIAVGLHADAEVAALIVAVIDGLQLRRLATGAMELDFAGPLKRILAALDSGAAPAPENT
jgi:AcrR family transcriptional regulator